MCQVITEELIKKMDQKLNGMFPEGKYEIDSSDGVHLNLQVTSKQFEGLSLMEQHQLVYKALQELISSGELHSIKIKTSLT